MFRLIEWLFGLVFGVVAFVFTGFAAVWGFGDAERRGKSGWLALLLILLVPMPIGLLVWLLIRPERRLM